MVNLGRLDLPVVEATSNEDHFADSAFGLRSVKVATSGFCPVNVVEIGSLLNVMLSLNYCDYLAVFDLYSIWASIAVVLRSYWELMRKV